MELNTVSAREQLALLLPYLQEPEPGGPPRPDPAGLDLATFDPLGAAYALVVMLRQGISPDVALGMLPAIAGLIAKGDLAGPPSALAARWRLLSPAELLTPLPPTEYLVGRMVPKGSLTVWYGAPGALKTMLLQDLAVCIALGARWLDPEPGSPGGAYPVAQGPVLWLDQDNGERRIRRRFAALVKGHGGGSPPLSAISFPSPPVSMAGAMPGRPNNLDPSLLAQQIGELGAVAVFLDNLGTLSGGADENSGEMIPVLANLRAVAEQTGAAILVIHHSRKGQAGGNGSRKGDSLRGHSSIEGALDLAMLIERPSLDADDITLQSTKSRDDRIPPFLLRWLFERDAAGELAASRFAFVEGIRPELPRYQDLAAELPALVEELIKDAATNNGGAGPNQSQLVSAAMTANADVGRNTALAAIRFAVGKKWLLERAKGSSPTAPKLYTVPEPADVADLADLQGVTL